MSDSAGKPILLCPLQYEVKKLQRGLRDRFELMCTGPGEAGIGRWLQQFRDVQRPVILVGLAGAISETIRAGSAAVISEVVEDGTCTRWRPTLDLPANAAVEACVITSTANVVAGVDDRRRLHARTGADLVDQESVPFATLATALGLRWGIVRGVSDDPRSGLPRGVERMVNESGRTRLLEVVRIVCRPSAVAGLWRLAKDSSRAMDDVRVLIGKSAL